MGFSKPKIEGFAVPKTVNYQSLSLITLRLESNQKLLNLNELISFTFNYNSNIPQLGVNWERIFLTNYEYE